MIVLWAASSACVHPPAFIQDTSHYPKFLRVMRKPNLINIKVSHDVCDFEVRAFNNAAA
jgi:hypothetical protein